jgi:hypothetical protein
MKLIGAFFQRIFGGFWSWIKETAWVQPLLIVGVIFAVIFSIPTISTWIQGIADNINSPETYYRTQQRKLEGPNDDEEESDAQKLVDAMLDGVAYEDNEKFILFFVQTGCGGCEELQPAVKLISENTSRFYGTRRSGSTVIPVTATDFGTFKFYTIFVDEEFANDPTPTVTPFQRFLNRNSAFREAVSDVAKDSYYFENGFITQTDVVNRIEAATEGGFITPTAIVYDLTSPYDGIAELFFNVPGSTSYDKATFLSNAWMHRVEFAPRNL